MCSESPEDRNIFSERFSEFLGPKLRGGGVGMRGGLGLCKSKTSVKLLDLEFSQGKYMYMIFSNVHIACFICDVIYIKFKRCSHRLH